MGHSKNMFIECPADETTYSLSSSYVTRHFRKKRQFILLPFIIYFVLFHDLFLFWRLSNTCLGHYRWKKWRVPIYLASWIKWNMSKPSVRTHIFYASTTQRAGVLAINLIHVKSASGNGGQCTHKSDEASDRRGNSWIR